MGQFPNEYDPVAANALVGTEEILIDASGTKYILTSELKKYLNRVEVNDQEASYSLVLTDEGKVVRMNVTGANTLTVPPNGTVAFPIGTQIAIRQAGAGTTTIVAGSGVTINASSLEMGGQNTAAALVKIGTNIWDLYLGGTGGSVGGDVTAPTLSTATVEDAAPDELVLTYNEALDEGSTPANGDFAVTADAVANAVTGVVVSGTTVTLTLTTPIANGEDVEIDYTPGTNKIQDEAGNDAAALSNQAVTNNVAATGLTVTDADAQAYVTAAALTDQGDADAVDAMIIALKAQTAIWNKRYAGFIMWDSFNKSKIDLFDPTTSAKNLTQTGTGAFAAGGFTNENTTSGAGLYTSFQPADVDASGIFSRVVTIKTDVSGTTVALGIASINDVSADYFIPRNASNNSLFRGGGTTTNTKANGNSIGRYVMTTHSGDSETYKNGTSLGNSAAYTPGANTASSFIIGNGGNSSGALPSYLPYIGQISLAMWFDELTDAEVTTLDGILSTFETAIGR